MKIFSFLMLFFFSTNIGGLFADKIYISHDSLELRDDAILIKTEEGAFPVASVHVDKHGIFVFENDCVIPNEGESIANFGI